VWHLRGEPRVTSVQANRDREETTAARRRPDVFVIPQVTGVYVNDGVQ
jgi:hypothetical protein